MRALLTSLVAKYKRTKIGFAGIWLLILYAIFSTFVVLSFSALQLQLSIEGYKAKNGKELQIVPILEIYKRWKDNDELLNDTEKQYRIISNTLTIKANKGMS